MTSDWDSKKENEKLARLKCKDIKKGDLVRVIDSSGCNHFQEGDEIRIKRVDKAGYVYFATCQHPQHKLGQHRKECGGWQRTRFMKVI